MHPSHFWWLVEARKAKKQYGRLDEGEVAELYEKAYGSQTS